MENEQKKSEQFKEISKEVSTRFSRRHIGTFASSIAFFFFLSVIPLLIVFVYLVPASGVGEAEMSSFLTQLTPDIADSLVETIIHDAYDASHGVLPVSALILLWAASQGTIALLFGLNNVYEVEEKRNYFSICVTAMLYTFVLMFLLAGLMYVIFGGLVINMLNDIFPHIEFPALLKAGTQNILFLSIATFFFGMIYTFIPAGRRTFMKQLPGAVFSSVAWLIFSLFFRLYINGINRYTSFYGSLGAVAVLLFWLYCCFYILLLGGFINRYFMEGRIVHDDTGD